MDAMGLTAGGDKVSDLKVLDPWERGTHRPIFYVWILPFEAAGEFYFMSSHLPIVLFDFLLLVIFGKIFYLFFRAFHWRW